MLTLLATAEHKYKEKRQFEVCPGTWEECYRQCLESSCIGVDPVTCGVASTGCSFGTFSPACFQHSSQDTRGDGCMCKCTRLTLAV